MDGIDSGLYSGLWLMSFSGFTINKCSSKHILLVCLVFGLTLLTLSLNLVMYLVEVGYLNVATKQIETFAFCFQILIKLAVLWYNRNDLLHLLNMRKQFLNFALRNSKNSTKLLGYLRKSLLLSRAYRVFAVVNLLMAIFKPFYLKELPLYCWTPNKYYLNFKSIYFVQIFWLFMIVPSIIGFDVVFYCLCAELLGQLQCLCYKLKEHEFLDEISVRNCVKQHTFLIKFINKMKSIYSGFFIMQLFNATVLICLESYFSITTARNITTILQIAFIIVIVVIQLLLYCILASEISEKGVEIGQAVLSGEWYRCSLKVKKSLLLIVLRSQRPIYFTAGGLVHINRATATKVFKSSMSIFTVLKSLNEKTK